MGIRRAREMSLLPSVTIVVPVFNEEASIGACLDSLLGQEYPHEKLEIIVVDNGSSDRSLEILSTYTQRLILLNEQRRGPAATRNTGIAAANGEIIVFTDANCVAGSDDWLLSLVAPLSERQVGLVGGKILALPPASDIERYSETLDDHEKALGDRLPTAFTGNWASRTADIRALGGFDPEFIQGEDSDLSLRLFLAGHSFRYQPSAIVYHQNEETFGKLFQEGYRQGMASVRLARKHSETYRKFGVRRIYPQTYADLIWDLFAQLSSGKRTVAACSLCFHSGKKVGKIAGSFRYRRFEL